ncbi:hypothetical protein B0O80DRAFT_257532 [Mortierella sp. GBAus27b]|nr:hypothetical protein B0O80DRAFT_257532 [Mortierella sp. GBAus27b]
MIICLSIFPSCTCIIPLLPSQSANHHGIGTFEERENGKTPPPPASSSLHFVVVSLLCSRYDCSCPWAIMFLGRFLYSYHLPLLPHLPTLLLYQNAPSLFFISCESCCSVSCPGKSPG